MSFPRGTSIGFVILSAVMSSPVFGHDRPPMTVSIGFRPGVPEDMIVATSFGLLVSRDAGESWRWICEEAIGHGDSEAESSARRVDMAV